VEQLGETYGKESGSIAPVICFVMIIWLASYPRSGNTFTRAVLRHYFDIESFSIHGDYSDIGKNDRLGNLVGHSAGDLSTLDLNAMRNSKELFFIKTHHIPHEYMERQDGVIYVVRNGMDACLSYLKYIHNISGIKETCLQDVLTGKVMFGLWGNHVLRWNRATFKERHWFKFEEIIAEPDSFADQLSNIVGKPRSREPFPTFSEFKATDPKFFGSGRAGAHLSELSEADVAVFNFYNGPAMNLAGYCSKKVEQNEQAAYSMFCATVELGNELTKTNTQLTEENTRLRKENGRFERRYKRFKKYAGVELFFRALTKVKTLDSRVRN
jgi:hypothetical protein